MLIHAYTKKSGQKTGKSHLCAVRSAHCAQSASSVYQKWHTPIRCKADIGLSGAVGGKTSNILVLTGSSIIESGRGSDGGAPQCFGGLTYIVRAHVHAIGNA